MPSTSTMNSMIHFGTGLITTPADGTVSTVKLEDGAVTGAKVNSTFDVSAKTVTLPASVSGLGTGITNAQLAGSITDAKITGLSSSKLTGALPAISGAALTALTATNIGSGTVPTARLGSGTASSSTILYGDQTYKAEPTTDLTPLRQDIITLALKQGVQENMTKHNLPSSAVVVFQADADFNLAGSTDIVRDSSNYISTIVPGTADGPNIIFCGHMDDVGLTDSSSFGWATTLRSGVARSSAESKFGSYSAESSGASGATMYTGSFGSNLTTENFTVDFWAKNKSTGQGGANRVMSLGNGSIPGTAGTGPSFSWAWAGAGSTNLNLYNEYADPDINPTPASGMTLDTGWNHYAWMRNGRDIHWAQDGVWKGSYTNMFDADGTGATMNNGSYSLGIFGRGGTTSEIFNAYIDEFRVSKVQQYTVDVDFTPETSPYGTGSASATGTALGTTNVPSSAVTEVSGVLLLKNAFGSNTLGTDVKVYFTADNSNWTEATSYTSAGTFSTGVTQITLGKTTVTSGSDVRWKIVFANQVADTKVAQIHGIGTNY